MDHYSDLLSETVAQLRAVPWRHLPALAKASGVPESTIKKIRSGETDDPRIRTIEALRRYFSSVPKPIDQPKEAEHA